MFFPPHNEVHASLQEFLFKRFSICDVHAARLIEPSLDAAWLLRTRRERQRDRRTAKQRDELATLQLSKLHPLPQPWSDSIAD
jgi:hypothetical protein